MKLPVGDIIKSFKINSLYGLSSFDMVPRRGLEPPPPCEDQHLKLACLPISPPGQWERFPLTVKSEARTIGTAGFIVNYMASK